MSRSVAHGARDLTENLTAGGGTNKERVDPLSEHPSGTLPSDGGSSTFRPTGPGQGADV
ncbi:MAG: hypothetical protein H7247_08430 [Polaromonas sp.]|nr:hypothetical protein [Gemmatimonadaceae bacterium]